MPVDYTITDDGPPAITQPQARAANVEDWKGTFGDDARTEATATDGQLIDLHTTSQVILFQAVARLWADTFVRSARGAGLDGRLDGFGLTRAEATLSVGFAVWYGAELTPIPQGSQVQTTGAGNLFGTTALATTGALLGSDVWVWRVPATVTTGVSYTADIDGTPYTHVTLGGQTPEDVRDAVEALVNLGADGTALAAGTDASGRPLLVIDVTGGPGIVTASSSSGTPPDAFTAARAPVEATDTGPITAPAGTLQDVPTPIAGITGATNDTDASPGRNEATDDEFRATHLDRLFGRGNSTDQATRVAVLEVVDAQGVPFVVSCDVRSNRSSVVDSAGRPPKSFETIVRYTDTAPADANARVAAAIGSSMPSGIEPYGQTFTESVETYPGNFVDVSATIIATLYLHLSITVTPGENFPEQGDQEQAIAEAVAAAWEIIAAEGQDWYRTSSSGAVSAAVGGTAITIAIQSDLTALPTDVPSFANVDSQPATDREIIDLDSGRVAVTIV